MIRSIALLLFGLSAQAAVNCNQSESDPALFPGVSAPTSQADILAAQNVSGTVFLSIGMSNTNQLFAELIPLERSDLTFVNGACGGCTASEFAKPSGKGWGNVSTQLSRAGKSTGDVAVVWIMAVNRAIQPLDPYLGQLTSDLNKVVTQVRSKFPGALILMSGLHHETFAPPDSKQPADYARESNNVVNAIVAANSDVLWGPYFWNPAPQARADGFNITCAMANGKGGVHLTKAGSQYAATWFMTWFDLSPVGAAIYGGAVNPPEQCPVPSWATQCRFRNGECQCR